MIIECVNCIKKFNVNPDLIPEAGRQINCGSCNHSWFFKKENFFKIPLTINNTNNEQDLLLVKNNNSEINDPLLIKKNTKLSTDVTINKIDDSQINFKHKDKIIGKKTNNFFSYLLVLIISFVAFIILVDTLKSPLINLFPGLEILLFNLFETLKDIKLFIIDLT